MSRPAFSHIPCVPDERRQRERILARKDNDSHMTSFAIADTGDYNKMMKWVQARMVQSGEL